MKKLYILLFLSLIVCNAHPRDITVQYAMQLAKKKFIEFCPNSAQDLTALTQTLFESFKNKRNHINQQTVDAIVKTMIEDHFENGPIQKLEKEDAPLTNPTHSFERDSDTMSIAGGYARSAAGTINPDDLSELYVSPEASSSNDSIDVQEKSREIKLEIEDTSTAQETAHHFGEEFPLPASLANRNVHHVCALQQYDLSCGYRAIINAWAIQELLQAGVPLNSQSIAQKASEKMHLIPRNTNMIELQDIITQLNSVLNVENLYCLQANRSSVQPAGIGNLTTMHFDECFAYLKNEDDAHALFITHKPGHWLLNAVVKQHGQKPYILVLDSQNARINENDPLYKAAEYIADQLEN